MSFYASLICDDGEAEAPPTDAAACVRARSRGSWVSWGGWRQSGLCLWIRIGFGSFPAPRRDSWLRFDPVMRFGSVSMTTESAEWVTLRNEHKHAEMLMRIRLQRFGSCLVAAAVWGLCALVLKDPLTGGSCFCFALNRVVFPSSSHMWPVSLSAVCFLYDLGLLWRVWPLEVCSFTHGCG